MFTHFKKKLSQIFILLSEKCGLFKRKVIMKEKDIEAFEVIDELYQMVDEAFLFYNISLAAPRAWRPHLESYEAGYRKVLQEEGVASDEIERRLSEQDHIFSDEEFQVQVNTRKVRKALMPGVFENLQAKNTLKIVYDSWESIYRPQLKKFIGEEVRGDVWGDLRLIRHSLAHRDAKAIEGIKKAKLITSFVPGQEIVLTPAIMGKIGQELENWYTEFLIKYFPREKKG